jgi:hypothetical protein
VRSFARHSAIRYGVREINSPRGSIRHRESDSCIIFAVPLQSTPRCPFSLRSNESKSKYLCTFSQYGITSGYRIGPPGRRTRRAGFATRSSPGVSLHPAPRRVPSLAQPILGRSGEFSTGWGPQKVRIWVRRFLDRM